MSEPPCTGQWGLFDSTDLADHQAARAICVACPIIVACAAIRDDLLSQPYAGKGSGPQGTWAGKLLGRPARRPGGQRKEHPCGTERGYQAHRHKGEDCTACRAAHATYTRERRRGPS